MTKRQCSNCRWWKDAGLVAHREPPVYVQVRGIGLETRGPKALGYCEPVREIPYETDASGYVLTTQKHRKHCGLTAEDYTCSEWKERGDD
jgi:hypothetical protein